MKYLDAACRGRGTRDRTNRNLGEGFPKFSMFMGQHDPVTLLVCTRCYGQTNATTRKTSFGESLPSLITSCNERYPPTFLINLLLDLSFAKVLGFAIF